MLAWLCPHPVLQIVTKRIKMQGFIAGDYMADQELMHEFGTNMTKWVREGRVKVVNHVTEGIEHAGRAFIEVRERRVRSAVARQERAWLLSAPCCVVHVSCRSTRVLSAQATGSLSSAFKAKTL